MKTLTFTKVQSTGHDFVLIDNREKPFLAQSDYPRAALVLCDRHFGIGSDGLIILESSEKSSVRMVFFNPDGSRDVCGNGVRCAAKYLHACEGADGHSDRITVEMDSGTAECEITGSAIRTFFDYPRILDSEKRVKVAGRVFDGVLVDTGTPHCVTFVDNVPDFPLSTFGPLVEKSGAFSETVSFDLAHATSRSSVEVRIWERGAGETLACGTGAAAVVAAGQHRDIFDEDVRVKMPGGAISVTRAGGRLVQNGSARCVFKGSVDSSRIVQECAA